MNILSEKLLSALTVLRYGSFAVLAFHPKLSYATQPLRLVGKNSSVHVGIYSLRPEVGNG